MRNQVWVPVVPPKGVELWPLRWQLHISFHFLHIFNSQVSIVNLPVSFLLFAPFVDSSPDKERETSPLGSHRREWRLGPLFSQVLLLFYSAQTYRTSHSWHRNGHHNILHRVKNEGSRPWTPFPHFFPLFCVMVVPASLLWLLVIHWSLMHRPVTMKASQCHKLLPFREVNRRG